MQEQKTTSKIQYKPSNKRSALHQIFPGSGPARYRTCSGSGFVILFAVTVSSILLAIALGVANIALKEIKFGTSARYTNDAFFAADTGIESALFQDKAPGSICSPAPCTANFVIAELGSAGQSCVIVSATKTVSPDLTTIVAKGYNVGDEDCDSSNANRVERELQITY